MSNLTPPKSGDYTMLEDSGGNGGLLTRRRYLRSDSRMASKIISLGIVSDEEAAILLKAAARLAAEAATEGNARNYRAAMGILLAAAKLEQDAFLRQDEAEIHQHVHVNEIPDDARSFVDRIIGRLEGGEGGNGQVAPGGNGHALAN